MPVMDNKRKLSLRKASFLKIFQDDFVNKLPIPPSFTNIFGGEIPPWFILEIAGTRKCWRVDIEEDENGSVYLGYGFDCFVKAHSLETGNFLLFEHEIPSILGVKIYERDGSERTAEINFESEYEVGAASESPTETQTIHQERNASPCLTSHTMTPVQFRAKKKQRGAINSCNFESEYEVGATSESPTETPVIHQERNASPCVISHIMSPVQFRANKMQRGAINSCNFESEYEVGATSESPAESPIIHQERNANPCLTSHIMTPVQFRANKKQRGAINSCNFESEYEVGATSELHQERNASPCLTSHTMTPIQFRENKKQRGAIGNGGNGRKKCIVSATEHGVHFSLTWRKAHHFLYYLTIPRGILSGKSFSNKDKVTVTDVEGKSWQMELKIRPDGRVDFVQGWREFVNDNDLENGDKLTFEFMSNNNVIKVHVQRASQVNDPSQTEHEGINQPFEHINLTCEDEELVDVCTPRDKAPLNMGEFENSASIFKSSFSFTWTPKTRNSHLHIPKAIANKQKLENNDVVILCDPKGKQWLMGVKIRQSDGRVGISRGWNDFTKAYGFVAGDTLSFEFVTDRMMKLSVVRACKLDHPNSGAGTIIKQEVLKLD